MVYSKFESNRKVLGLGETKQQPVTKEWVMKSNPLSHCRIIRSLQPETPSQEREKKYPLKSKTTYTYIASAYPI